MTVKLLTGVYTAGYRLSAAYSGVNLTHSASVAGGDGADGAPGHLAGADGGVGLQAAFSTEIVNRGAIEGGAGGSGGHDAHGVGAGGDGGVGLLLEEGGHLRNLQSIHGGLGGFGGFGGAAGGIGGTAVILGAVGEVTNDGTLLGGYGGPGGSGRQLQGPGGAGGLGLELRQGGSVDNTGRIEGGAGAHSGYHIVGDGAGSAGGAGLRLGGDGTVSNTGRIEGGDGGYGGAQGGLTGRGGAGVDMAAGGLITNFAIGRIFGGAGAFGPVGGVGGTGAAGVLLEGDATVENAGTIIGGAGGRGSTLYGDGDGGLGGAGVALMSGGALRNLGTIQGGAAGGPGTDGKRGRAGDGVDVAGSAHVFNGVNGQGAAVTSARIQGAIGIYAGATAVVTVTNYGVIDGASGVALEFLSAADVLVVGARARFIGSVEGGGGTLELARGQGRLVRPFASGDITLQRQSGATLTFDDFATLDIGAGASFTTSAGFTMVAAQSLIAEGAFNGQLSGRTVTSAGLIETSGGKARLTMHGALSNTGTLLADGGTLSVTGALTGDGAVRIAAGTLRLQAANASRIDFTGPTGVLALGDAQAFTGQVGGFSTAGGTTLDLADIGFVSAEEASYAGTAQGGTLTVSDGVHTATIALVGDYLNADFTAAADGAGGTQVTASQAQAPERRLIEAMARMGVDPAAPVHAPPAITTAPLLLARPHAQAL